jgi:SSS family solute:Na+ symporter/cation/acetate symporter
VALVLVCLGPDVMGKDDAIWPLAIPAIVSVPAGFLFAYAGTKLGRGRVGATGMPYDEFETRAFQPAGAATRRFTREEREPAGVA